MKVRFALQKADPSALEESLAAISDSGSPRFRKYLSDTEVAHLVRPREGAAEAVEAWAHKVMGADTSLERSKHGEYVLLSSTASSVSKAFRGLIDNVTIFTHAASSTRALRAT